MDPGIYFRETKCIYFKLRGLKKIRREKCINFTIRGQNVKQIVGAEILTIEMDLNTSSI